MAFLHGEGPVVGFCCVGQELCRSFITRRDFFITSTELLEVDPPSYL